MKRLFCLGLCVGALALAAPASALPGEGPGDIERGYGMGYDSFDNPISIGARDANDVNITVDGRLTNASTLVGGLMDSPSGLGAAQALNAVLPVIVNSHWDATNSASFQFDSTNTGDSSAVFSGVN